MKKNNIIKISLAGECIYLLLSYCFLFVLFKDQDLFKIYSLIVIISFNIIWFLSKIILNNKDYLIISLYKVFFKKNNNSILKYNQLLSTLLSIIFWLLIYYIAKLLTDEILIMLYIASISFPIHYVVNEILEICYEEN